jgi:hypothetical protein
LLEPVRFEVGHRVSYKDMDLVTVVAVHEDSDEPYYTVKCKDGSEKQTVGIHLKKVTLIILIISYAYPNPNSDPHPNPITLTL